MKNLKLISIYSFIILFSSSCISTTYDNNVLIKTATEYSKDGLYKEAIDLYQKVLKKNPNDYQTRKLLGITFLKAKLYKKAIEHLEYIIDKFENDFETNFYLGEAYRALNKYAEAIYRYQKALQIDNSNIYALKSLSWSYFKIRYYSQALYIAEELYKAQPNDPQIIIILSRIYIQLKKYADATKIIQKTNKKIIQKFLPYFQNIKAEILSQTGNCNKAITLYKAAIKEKPFLASALLGLGKCLIQNNNPKGATYILRAIRSKPDIIEGYWWLAKYYENQNPKLALKYYITFSKLANHDPEFIDKISKVESKIKKLQISIKTQTKNNF